MRSSISSGMKNVCFQCEERTATCHDTCSRYLKVKEEYSAMKAHLRELKTNPADELLIDRRVKVHNQGTKKGFYKGKNW